MPVYSFGGAYKDRVYVRVSIVVSVLCVKFLCLHLRNSQKEKEFCRGLGTSLGSVYQFCEFFICFP